MTTKLTLTIEEEVIKSAKKYASRKGRSLSGLVENYLKSLSTAGIESTELSSKVRRLKGAVKLPDNFDYKSSLKAAVAKRHGK
jgi:Family of unknown function (DUF6364)